MHWFIDPIKNQYADFSGRTGLEAYWMFVLISFLLQIAITIVGGVVGVEALAYIVSLVILVPSIAIAARRLHDIGKSGWWQIVVFIPLIGIIVLIVWLATKGKDEDNQYGAGAKSSAVDTAQDAEVVMPPRNEGPQ